MSGTVLDETTAGECPSCGGTIPRTAVLFTKEFASVDGSLTYARCPNCREIVNPTSPTLRT